MTSSIPAKPGGTAELTLNLKVIFENKDIRRASLSASNYESLCGSLCEMFKLSRSEALTCCYEDEERDMVLINSDLELKEAVRQTQTKPTAALKLFVSRQTPNTTTTATATATTTVAAVVTAPAPTPAPAPPVTAAPAPAIVEKVEIAPKPTAAPTASIDAASAPAPAAALAAPVIVPTAEAKAAPITESVAPFDPTRPIVHTDTVCAICKVSPIVGTRLQCTTCPSFDMCEKCDESDQHPSNHVLIRARVPLECSPLCLNPCPPDCPITKAHRSYHARKQKHQPISWGAPDSSFVADVTIPDDAVVTAGSAITKVWAIQNVGPTQWPVSTELRCESGVLRPTGSFVTPLAAANETVNVSVPMRVPSESGVAEGSYRLFDTSTNQFFGAVFWIRVVVQAAVTATATTTATATAADSKSADTKTADVKPATPTAATTTAVAPSVLRQSSTPAAVASASASGDAANKPELKKPVSLAPYLSRASREEEERREAAKARAKSTAKYDGPFKEEIVRLRAMGFKESDDCLLSWIMLATDKKQGKDFDIVQWVCHKLLTQQGKSALSAFRF